jgi:cyclophilin family peptidyl-prolyl cis-trans isomerase
MTRSIKFLLASCLALALVTATFAQDKPATKPADPAPATQPKKDEPKKEETKKDDKPKPAASTDEFEYVKMTFALPKGVNGDVFVRLNKTKAPISTANFLTYVGEDFYNNTLIHRIVDQPTLHCIQGGGFDDKLHEKTTHKPIKNESSNGLKNKRGTISMARMFQPDSGSSQWFINTQDNLFLDNPQDSADKNSAYAVFGDVVAGMNIVDQAVKAHTTTKTGTRPDNKPIRLDDTPAENVLLKSVTKSTKEEADKAAAAEEKK